ncbi:MAG: hypothetical protein JWM93_1362 [Frankiales bacterium]|nr:hypothetical protein [Frankiales bacterium]
MTTPDDPDAQPQWNDPAGQQPPPPPPPYGAYPQLGYPADTMAGQPMGFITAVRKCLSNYATFSGRARRPEFWYFFLFNVLVDIVASVIDSAIGTDSQLVQILVGLALLIPGLAVGARRLHDTGKSGWWQLIGIIPIVGWIVLIVFFCTATTPQPNRYGPVPA